MKKIHFFSVLDVDAMFYQSAVNSLAEAKKNKNDAEIHENQLVELPWWDQYVAWDSGDEIDVGLSKEQIEIIEGIQEKARVASSRFLQATATTHIFCVAALEAHINKIASSFIKPKMFDHYEKLSIEGKWLFLPRFLGGDRDGFDPGHQPYQDFSQLIKFRNALVHYKGKKIPYFISDSTAIYKPLGLTLEEASKSVDATKKMILKLAEIMQKDPPKWIKDTASEYLKVHVVLE